MQLFVRAQETHALEVTGEETVGSVKTRVATLENLPEEELICYYAGEPLENERVLSTFAPENATLDILGRLLGGKVHGSLARAGKVKGQTPKVDKQEKKKKKTGRARRRQQYNCWFKNKVAATMGGGRRRGPNANS